MRLLTLAFLILFLSGCALRHTLKPSGLEIPTTQARQLLEQTRVNVPHSFRGLYTTSFESTGQRGTLRQIIIAKDRSHITIQTIPTNSAMTISQLELKDGQIIFQDFVNHQTIVDEANSNNLERLLGLRIVPEHFFDLILGRLPTDINFSDSKLKTYLDQPSSLLTIIKDDGIEAYKLDLKTGLLVQAVFNNSVSGKFDFSIDYSQFEKLALYTIPSNLKITSPHGTAKLTLNLSVFKSDS